MAIKNLKHLAPNIVCICVDNLVNGHCNGRFYHCYSPQPVCFEDICTLVLKIEELYDEIKFPQAATKLRHFFENTTEAPRKEPKKYMTPKEVTDQKGLKATFVVHVQYRQNSTWQGSVVWADKNISKNFRSTLELLKLIDGALNEDEDSLDSHTEQ